MNILEDDFEIGHLFRNSIVPKAILYYTGEISDNNVGRLF